MDRQEIGRLSIRIVQTYYQNDLRLFFEYLDEKVLWYGPAKGQFLSGRQALLDAWGQEENPLTFTLGNIRLDCAASHPAYCEVLLSFPVTTNYPSGEHIPVDQIIHITWCERKIEGMEGRQPRILVIHISNLYQPHEADNIYPVHFNQIYKGEVPISGTGRRLHFRGADRADHYLFPDSILWIESAGGSRHARLHMLDGTVDVTDSVQKIAQRHGAFFLRCHNCYLVNPAFIADIRRFQVILADGKALPIPEKKYTAFKAAVKAHLTESPGGPTTEN